MKQSVPSVVFLVVSSAVLLAAGCATVVGGSNTGGQSKGDPPPSDSGISVNVSPSSSSVQTAATQVFTASVVNDKQNKGVTWSLAGMGCDGAACGSLSAVSSLSGTGITYTAPSQAPPNPVTLTATPVADPSKSSSATIKVTAPAAAISVTVSPSNQSVEANHDQTFTATVQNDPQDKGVTWTLSGAGCNGDKCGKLSANSSLSGVSITYTAPAKVPNPPAVILTAASVTDSTKTSNAQLTIADSASRISVTVSPVTQTLSVTQSHSFTANVQNDPQNKGVNWSLSGTGCSGGACGTLSTSFSASGAPVTYTAPAKLPSPATVTLVATSVADTTSAASATVTITSTGGPSITVSVSPATQTVKTKAAQSFTGTVQNDPQSQGVNWSLSGAGCTGSACGTLSSTSSPSGTAITYTAPAAVPNPATVKLTATSISDTTKSVDAIITVVADTSSSIIVSVSPTSSTLAVDQTQTFAASVQNDSQNKGVTWSLSGAGCTGASCGVLSSNSSNPGATITYTAPATAPAPPTVTLTATSVSDHSKTASVTITITVPLSVTVSPRSQAVLVNESFSFTATVNNDPQGKGVRWALSGAGCTGSGCGTLSSTSTPSGSPVTYIAPASVPNPAQLKLTATSISDTKKSASATITIFQQSGATSVAIHPKRIGLTASQTFKFTASVQNDPTSQGVTWSASAGTFTNVTPSSALYQAPDSPGVYIVTATSVVDVNRSASATIGVTGLSGVTTYHNDLARDGVNAQEYVLTPSNVTSAGFGKLFSCAVDAAIYAQPLWVPQLSINGQPHNVIFVATSHNTVYAFDADASPCVNYWSKQLIPTGETWLNATDVQNRDITPDIGIVGTPVIDRAASALYVVTRTKNQGTSCTPSANCHQRIHALSLIDGSEMFDGPADITPSITVGGKGDGGNGTRVPFDPLHSNQRCGLALVNGSIYVAWGSHADWRPYHGWMMAFNKSNLLSSPVAYNTTPDSEGGGIWMSGGAPAVDSNDNLYVITGNGGFNGTRNFSDSFLKLSIASGFSLKDWFTRAEESSLQGVNQDLGAGGAAVLADLPSSPVQHLIIGGGKSGAGSAGELYVLNRDALGHLEGTGAPIVQKFSLGNGIFATPVFWKNTLFLAGAGGQLQSFALDPTTSQFNPTPTSYSPDPFGYPGATPSLSANGSSQGIIWALNNSRFATPAPAILYAFDATNLSNEIWNSSQAAANRDQAGNGVKFTVPTIANGKVYIGTASEVDVYGLLPD